MTLAVRVISFLNFLDEFIHSYISNLNLFAKISTLLCTFEAENGKKFKRAEAQLRKGCAYKKSECTTS